jgi:hypothetical protein
MKKNAAAFGMLPPLVTRCETAARPSFRERVVGVKRNTSDLSVTLCLVPGGASSGFGLLPCFLSIECAAGPKIGYSWSRVIRSGSLTDAFVVCGAQLVCSLWSPRKTRSRWRAPLDEFRHSSGIIVTNEDFQYYFRQKRNAERAAIIWLSTAFLSYKVPNPCYCHSSNARLCDAGDIDEQQIDT